MSWVNLKEDIQVIFHELSQEQQQEEHLHKTYQKFLAYKRAWYKAMPRQKREQYNEKQKITQRRYIERHGLANITAKRRAEYWKNPEKYRAKNRERYALAKSRS